WAATAERCAMDASSVDHSLSRTKEDSHWGSETYQSNGAPCDVRSRLRVDGKFFARGSKRLRLKGVTYGPFSPNSDGHPFPTSERVKEDFTQMQALGINSIRTYHIPPE